MKEVAISSLSQRRSRDVLLGVRVSARTQPEQFPSRGAAPRNSAEAPSAPKASQLAGVLKSLYSSTSSKS